MESKTADAILAHADRIGVSVHRFELAPLQARYSFAGQFAPTLQEAYDAWLKSMRTAVEDTDGHEEDEDGGANG